MKNARPDRSIAIVLGALILASATGCVAEPKVDAPSKVEAEVELGKSLSAQQETMETIAKRTVDYLGKGRIERSPRRSSVLACEPDGGGRGAETFSTTEVYFPVGEDLQDFIVRLRDDYALRGGWEVHSDQTSQGIWVELWSADGTQFHVRQNINFKSDGESRFSVSSFGACIKVPKDFDMFAKVIAQ